LPFVIAGVVVLHIWALHVSGKTTPPASSEIEGRHRSFHPARDHQGRGRRDTVSWLLFAAFVFYAPDSLGDPDNFIRRPGGDAAGDSSRNGICAILRDLRAMDFNIGPLDSKLAGVLTMFASIGVIFILPWLRSIEGAGSLALAAGRAHPLLCSSSLPAWRWAIAGGQPPDKCCSSRRVPQRDHTVDAAGVQSKSPSSTGPTLYSSPISKLPQQKVNECGAAPRQCGPFRLPRCIITR